MKIKVHYCNQGPVKLEVQPHIPSQILEQKKLKLQVAVLYPGTLDILPAVDFAPQIAIGTNLAKKMAARPFKLAARLFECVTTKDGREEINLDICVSRPELTPFFEHLKAKFIIFMSTRQYFCLADIMTELGCTEGLARKLINTFSTAPSEIHLAGALRIKVPLCRLGFKGSDYSKEERELMGIHASRTYYQPYPEVKVVYAELMSFLRDAYTKTEADFSVSAISQWDTLIKEWYLNYVPIPL